MVKSTYKDLMAKGYMKNVRALYKTAAKLPEMENQVDNHLSRAMNSPRPLSHIEIAELHAQGIETKNCYVAGRH